MDSILFVLTQDLFNVPQDSAQTGKSRQSSPRA